MWCALPAACNSMCSVSLALFTTARKNSSSSSWSKPPVAPGGSSAVEREEPPARDVDRAGSPGPRPSARSPAVTADPGPVAKRLVERLAEDDAGVLDGVVAARLEVAADL